MTPLHESLAALCSLAKQRSSITKLTVAGDQFGRAAIVGMKAACAELEAHFGTQLLERPTLRMSYSRGLGRLPRVFWIGVVPTGRTAGNSLSATVCFAKDGSGLVAGIMTSSLFPTRVSCVKRSTLPSFLDVDGPNRETKYNDRFLIPKDFLISDFSEEAFVAHFQNCLSQLRRHLRSGIGGN